MAAVLKSYVALFPAAVKNVLVVVSDIQDARATAATLAAMGTREAMRVHLLSIQSPPSTHAGLFLRSINFRKVQRDAALAALVPLCRELDSLGVAYRSHVAMSPWLAAIARFARDTGCTHVVVGDNPHSALRRLVLRHDCWRIRSFLRQSGRDCPVIRREHRRASDSPDARGLGVLR
jgi:nucleotide-binding universal stress UspA family protein